MCDRDESEAPSDACPLCGSSDMCVHLVASFDMTWPFGDNTLIGGGALWEKEWPFLEALSSWLCRTPQSRASVSAVRESDPALAELLEQLLTKGDLKEAPTDPDAGRWYHDCFRAWIKNSDAETGLRVTRYHVDSLPGLSSSYECWFHEDADSAARVVVDHIATARELLAPD